MLAKMKLCSGHMTCKDGAGLRTVLLWLECERRVDTTHMDTTMNEETMETNTPGDTKEPAPVKKDDETHRKISDDVETFVLPPTLLWKGGLRIRARKLALACLTNTL